LSPDRDPHNNPYNKTDDIAKWSNIAFTSVCKLCNHIDDHSYQDKVLIGKRFGAYHVRCIYCKKIYYVAGTMAGLKRYMKENHNGVTVWPAGWAFYEGYEEPYGTSGKEKYEIRHGGNIGAKCNMLINRLKEYFPGITTGKDIEA